MSDCMPDAVIFDQLVSMNHTASELDGFIADEGQLHHSRFFCRNFHDRYKPSTYPTFRLRSKKHRVFGDTEK